MSATDQTSAFILWLAAELQYLKTRGERTKEMLPPAFSRLMISPHPGQSHLTGAQGLILNYKRLYCCCIM